MNLTTPHSANTKHTFPSHIYQPLHPCLWAWLRECEWTTPGRQAADSLPAALPPSSEERHQEVAESHLIVVYVACDHFDNDYDYDYITSLT